MTTRFVLGVWTLALLAAAGAIAIILTSDHASDELATIALAVPTELVFVASGLVARARQPDNRTGWLLIAVGFAWFLGALRSADQPVVFTAGLVVGGLFIGVLVHLLLAFPSGRVERRGDRVLIAAVYILVLAGPLLVFLFDATPELDCEGSCPENVLAVTDAPQLAQAAVARSPPSAQRSSSTTQHCAISPSSTRCSAPSRWPSSAGSPSVHSSRASAGRVR